MKYNFYSNQLAEPKEDSLQAMSTTSNLQYKMISMVWSRLASHEWNNSFALFVPKYFQKQNLLKQILRSGTTMSKEERTKFYSIYEGSEPNRLVIVFEKLFLVQEISE
jgi:hypothetical protein